MPCKVCESETRPVFETMVLERHPAVFTRCTRCGFMAAEDVTWLDEAYSSAINDIDLGTIWRATGSVGLIEGLILSTFDAEGSFVDYGAGYGVLVRLMRDLGFDFHWTDKYCDNLFAQQFVAEPGTRYELLTAFEVFEHLVDPVAEVTEMLTLSDTLLFSTLLVPDGITKAEDWWYFGPDHGQHIAFYTPQALGVLAERFDLHLCSDGVESHLLSRREVPQKRFELYAGKGRRSRLMRKVMRRRMSRQTLLDQDFRMVSGYSV